MVAKKFLLNNFEAPHLDTPKALRKFVGSLYGASNGNPAIFPLLVEAFQQWHGEFDDGERERAELERLWKSFDVGQPIPDPIPTLKKFCRSQPIPLLDSMVHAIFDDPSFDFTAYLDCLPPRIPFVVVRCLPPSDAEFASRWLAAASQADRILSDHCITDPEFKSAIDSLGVVSAVEFSPAAMAFVHFWLDKQSAFSLNLFDLEWAQNFAFMAAAGFFSRTGQHYQMTVPDALTTETIARAMLQLAATEDNDYYLHPESILTTMTKAEACRAVRSIKWPDRTQLTTWSDSDASPAERLNDLKAKN